LLLALVAGSDFSFGVGVYFASIFSCRAGYHFANWPHPSPAFGVHCPVSGCVWAGGNPGQPRSEPPAIAISVLINFFDCQMQSRQAVAGNDLRNWVPKTQGKNGGKQAWHNRKIGLAVWK